MIMIVGKMNGRMNYIVVMCNKNKQVNTPSMDYVKWVGQCPKCSYVNIPSCKKNILAHKMNGPMLLV